MTTGPITGNIWGQVLVAREGPQHGGSGAPPPRPHQQFAARTIEYAANCAVVVIAVILVSVVLAKLAAVDFPGLSEVLDGRDLLTLQDNPNYLRNLLELTSFLATTGVLATALWAFAFTKTQIREAKDTRLATLYATLEQRWSSEQMLRSKALFSQMTRKYNQYASSVAKRDEEPISFPQFAHDFIMTLQATRQYDYFTLMALPEYLEYIGMLSKQKYLNIDDIDYILGMVYIEVASTFAVHIDHLREQGATIKKLNSMERAPQEFYCLTYLEEVFLERYRAASPPAP
jgi:hypothetical protein